MSADEFDRRRAERAARLDRYSKATLIAWMCEAVTYLGPDDWAWLDQCEAVDRAGNLSGGN